MTSALGMNFYFQHLGKDVNAHYSRPELYIVENEIHLNLLCKTTVNESFSYCEVGKVDEWVLVG